MALSYIPLNDPSETFQSAFTKTNNAIGEIIVSGQLSGSTLNLNKYNGTTIQITGFTGLSGGVTGVTSGTIIAALGYTPYDGASNPNNFLTLSSGDTRYYLKTNPNNFTSANTVTAGSYNTIFVDNRGLIISGSNVSYSTSTGGITSINALTSLTQTLLTGNTGNDFQIVSSISSHTFNLPNASASARGLLTSTDFNTFNNKLSQNQNIVLNGDVTGSGITSITTTLLSIITPNIVGSSTQIPIIQFDSKGRITSATTVMVAGGAGSSGITAINNQTNIFQALITGDTGTDFTISSSAGIHSFNLPTASSGNSRGLLSGSDYSKFNTYIVNDSSVTSSNTKTWSIDVIKNYIATNQDLIITRGNVPVTSGTIDWSAYDIQVFNLTTSLTINSITNISLGKRILVISGTSDFNFSSSTIPSLNIVGSKVSGQSVNYFTVQCVDTIVPTFIGEWFNQNQTGSTVGLSQISGLTILGNNSNSFGLPSGITALSDFQILRRSGTTLGFGSIDLSQSNSVGNSILNFNNGGTGINSYNVGDILISSGVSGFVKISAVTSGQFIKSSGVNSIANWGNISKSDLTNILSFKGEIINENFNTSFGNYAVAGSATWSIVSNMLEANGGTTMVLSNYIRHSGWGSTCISNFTMVCEVVVGPISANTHGVGISFQSTSLTNKSNHFILRLDTTNKGALESYCDNSTGPVSGFILNESSVEKLQLNATDRIRLTVNVSQNEYIFTAKNLSLTSSQGVTLCRTVTPVNPPTYTNFNTGQFALNICGGLHYFDLHTVTVNEVIGADIMFCGDSITRGAAVINKELSYTQQLEKMCNSKISVWAGGGNKAADVLGRDILRYTPQNVVISVGVNDVIAGRTPSQITTDIQTIITDLGSGYTLGTNVFVSEILPYSTFGAQIVAANSALRTSFEAGIIDTYKAFSNASSGLQTIFASNDLLHPNAIGHKLLADIFYQFLLEKNKIKPSFTPITNNLPAYTHKGYLGQGIVQFTPAFAINAIDPSYQIGFGTDVTNPLGGGNLLSTTVNSALLTAGAYFNGSSIISTSAAGQSQVQLNNGAINLRSKLGIAVSGTVSWDTYFSLTSAGLIGTGLGNTSPVSQIHINSDGASNRGLTIDQHASSIGASLLNLRKSRSTLASPTTVVTLDYCGSVLFSNYSGTQYLTNVNFGSRVNGTVTTSSVPTEFYIATSSIGTSDPFTDGTIRFLITPTGSIGIGTVTPTSILDIANGSANNSAFRLRGQGVVISPNDGDIWYESGTTTLNTRQSTVTKILSSVYRNAQSGTTYTSTTIDFGGRTVIGLTNAAARSVVLPIPSTVKVGPIITIKDEAGTATTANITVTVLNGALIDGSATNTLNLNYMSKDYYSDGTNYFVI